MDLGAVVCRPSAPACSECPLRSKCAYRGVGDDPAVGSAGVSRTQARFEGSDRQARGRLMKALADGDVAAVDLSRVMSVSVERAERLARALEGEGLVVRDGVRLRLP